MSSNFIPMLPSTPPPLDESIESDEDELGGFTAVLGKYDDSLTEVPKREREEPQIKTEKNNCTNHYVQSRNDINIQKTEIHFSNSYNHFGDFPEKSIVKDKSDGEDIKPSRKSMLERNGKAESVEADMQENIQVDGSEKHPPTDSESQTDSSVTVIQEQINDDKASLLENNQKSLVEDNTTLSGDEISDKRDGFAAEIGVPTLPTALQVREEDSATEEMIENERIGSPSQQYITDDSGLFTLPLVPKLTETLSFPEKSNLNSLEPSPISVSDNFASVSDASSELSNFETAKSSPNSIDTCDKQEMANGSESSNNCIQGKKDTEHEIRGKDSTGENSCNSVSPLVFQEIIPVEINSEEEDFADFQQAADDIYFTSTSGIENDESKDCPIQDQSEEMPETTNCNADCEEFADFAQASSNNDDFESAPESSVWTQSQDDFADFEQASFESGTIMNESENCVVLTEISNKGKGKVTQLVYASFPMIYEDKTPEADEVFPFKNETDYTSMLLRGRSKRLWDRLQDLDTTPAMLFRWGSSQCFQAMLHSLNIDSHSILRNTSVPIYASSLGLLEPTKGPQSPKHQTIVNKHISFQELVPPAQFDWSDSGLINPLDTSQTPGLFDLDFFTAQNNSMPSTTDVAGSDFEAELFGPSSVCVASGDKDNQSPLITQILASTKSTIFPPVQKQCIRPAGLSEEVVRVLDKLPGLSFMQAKVLMFPIHSLSSDH